MTDVVIKFHTYDLDIIVKKIKLYKDIIPVKKLIHNYKNLINDLIY